MKKFIESLSADDISVMTDTGWEPVIASHKTIQYQIWNVKLTNGYELNCADEHILFDENYQEVFVKDLKSGDSIITEQGLTKIKSINKTNKSENMYDLEINSANHRYYTNGLLSHNTTVILDILANTKRNNAKVLFISAEMNQIDLFLYVKRFPKFGDIDILFPQEIPDTENPKHVIESVLSTGYDLILTDSFVELQQIIREMCGITGNAAEKYLLNLMYKHNLGNNESGKFTSFLNIQQVNKGGVFVGSNKLKHMTTGMMEIRFENEDEDERFITFSKNRRGHVGKKMYFDLSGLGDVVYDIEKFRKTEKAAEMKKLNKEKLKTQEGLFDELMSKIKTGKDSE